MKLVVPHTGVRPTTQLYLDQLEVLDPVVQEVEYKDVSSDHWAYTRVLEQEWQQRESFVLMEHDTIPWPGAITQIWRCPYDWCFYGYTPDIDLVENGCAPFGLVKIGAPIIKTFPEVWSKMREYYDEDYELAWMYHDIWMFDYIVNKLKGPKPHQHYPSVFNANPGGSEGLFGE